MDRRGIATAHGNIALEDMGLQRLEQITDLTLQLQAADPEDASSEWVSIGPLPVSLGES